MPDHQESDLAREGRRVTSRCLDGSAADRSRFVMSPADRDLPVRSRYLPLANKADARGQRRSKRRWMTAGVAVCSAQV